MPRESLSRLWSAPILSLYLININYQSMISRYCASLKDKREVHQCSLNWDSVEKKPSTWPLVDIWWIEGWWDFECLLVLRENWVVIDRILIKHWCTSMFSLVPTSHIAPTSDLLWFPFTRSLIVIGRISGAPKMMAHEQNGSERASRGVAFPLLQTIIRTAPVGREGSRGEGEGRLFPHWAPRRLWSEVAAAMELGRSPNEMTHWFWNTLKSSLYSHTPQKWAIIRIQVRVSVLELQPRVCRPKHWFTWNCYFALLYPLAFTSSRGYWLPWHQIKVQKMRTRYICSWFTEDWRSLKHCQNIRHRV